MLAGDVGEVLVVEDGKPIGTVSQAGLFEEHSRETRPAT